MDFGSLGEKKKAIFCLIPVDDSSMNYLVGMLYTQCFQALYRRADAKYNGRLPVPVRVIQDEWANVAQPESYPKILATCRSYNIGLNIIVQNIQQIKALYEKEWEGIIGNCDTLLFLGGGQRRRFDRRVRGAAAGDRRRHRRCWLFGEYPALAGDAAGKPDDHSAGVHYDPHRLWTLF